MICDTKYTNLCLGDHLGEYTGYVSFELTNNGSLSPVFLDSFPRFEREWNRTTIRSPFQGERDVNCNGEQGVVGVYLPCVMVKEFSLRDELKDFYFI